MHLVHLCKPDNGIERIFQRNLNKSEVLTFSEFFLNKYNLVNNYIFAEEYAFFRIPFLEVSLFKT